MNKTIITILIVAVIVSISITILFNSFQEKEMEELQNKVEFLEYELATERLHNEWENMSLEFMAYGLESYMFRGKTFEEGSECAQYFIDYQTSRPYDIFVKAPALMKFDKSCNPQAP